MQQVSHSLRWRVPQSGVNLPKGLRNNYTGCRTKSSESSSEIPLRPGWSLIRLRAGALGKPRGSSHTRSVPFGLPCVCLGLFRCWWVGGRSSCTSRGHFVIKTWGVSNSFTCAGCRCRRNSWLMHTSLSCTILSANTVIRIPTFSRNKRVLVFGSPKLSKSELACFTCILIGFY